MKRVSVFVMLLLLCAPALWAGSITVWGSGRDSSGNALSGGSLDPHYTITAYNGSTLATPLATYVVNADPNLYPYTIAATNSLSPDVLGNGLYTYTTYFDLTGYNPNSASLTGVWGGDDYPGGVYLNGKAVNAPTTSNQCCYFQGNLLINSGFVNGTNQLSFVINQADNWYDYARIQNMTVTVDPAVQTVPEPASVVLLGSGIIGIVGRLRKKMHA